MKKPKEKRTKLTAEHTVRTLSIKVYDEQIPQGWENCVNVIINIDSQEYQIIAICHDSDLNKDDVWKPSAEKRHYHIIIRKIDGTPTKVRTILNMLGIVFRKGIDDTLFFEHGCETVENFTSMALYLTHETEAAQLEGKFQYDRSKLVSNLTEEDIDEIRNGYVKLTNGKRKAGIEEMRMLDKEAEQIGYELKDFDEWYHNLDIVERSNTKMKQVKESYKYGIERRMNEQYKINRTCIFIKGMPNCGKTYATTTALKNLNKRILNVSGGGSGKFDNLRITTQAIVIDDDISPNLMNMTDNYICQAYKRGSNNPYWTGKYFIVTSNKDFREWVRDCGIYDKEQIRAVESRFFICHIAIENNTRSLICDMPSNRGAESDKIERIDQYKKFRDEFNKTIKDYVPVTTEIDYTDLNENVYA